MVFGLLAGLSAPGRADSIAGLDWIDFRAQGLEQVGVPVLPPERELALRDEHAGFVELLRSAETRLRGDGTAEQRITNVRRFLSADGVDAGGTLRIEVIPARESLVIEAAYVITREGERVRVEPEIVQVSDVVQSGLFLGLKEVAIPLPGLAPGATGVVVFSTRVRRSEWPLPWAQHVSLQSTAPIERFTLRVDWDEGVPAPAWRAPHERLDCAESTRRVECGLDHVPASRPDVDLGIARDQVPEFVVAERRSWAQIADEIGELVEQRVREGVPADLVKRLVGDAATEADRFRRVFDFVSNDIRYVGLEQGTGAVVPRPPVTTLERRFGDCKDKVTLLVALARAARLDAYPVLVGTQRQDRDAIVLPSASYFDHMIVCWKPGDGDERCADPTVTNATPTASALPNGGRIALRLWRSARAPSSLPSAPFGWVVKVGTEIEVRCDGSILTETTREFRALGKIALRQNLLHMSPADRDRFLVAEDRRVRNAALPADVRLHGISSRDEPVRIVSRHEMPAQVAIADGYQHIDQDPWLVHYGLSFRMDNRVYRVWNPGLELTSTRDYRLCDQVEVEYLGPALAFEDGSGSLSRSYRPTPEGARVESRLVLNSGALDLDAIERANGFLEQALDQSTIWFSTRASR